MTGTIFDLSSSAGSNSLIEGVNVGEGCPASNVNDGLRGLAAAARNTFSSDLQTFLAGSAPLPVAKGGTAATTPAAARTSLGAAASGSNSDITALTALATPLSIPQGGTGQSSAAAALAALGGLSITAQSLADPGYIQFSNGLVIQWIKVAVTAGGSSAFVWPIAFPSAVFSAVAGSSPGLTFSGSQSPYLTNVTKTGGTAWGSNGGGVATTTNIIAIGN